jgi:uncharacterized protein YcbX
MMTPTVSGLYCYPIKSCRGIPLQRTSYSLRGILYDREWAVVDVKSGKVLTQREEPKLCLIETAFKGATLEISSQGSGVEVPLDTAAEPPNRRKEVRVWDDRVVGYEQDMWASGWISAFLRRNCVLVRMGRDHVRPSRGKTRIAFADSHEVLVISEASLADLNGRMEAPLPMDRFRPNVVVAGCPPYAEDAWTAFSIGGGVRLLGSSPCIRCPITTTDQATAERGKEPLKTLATYRKMPKGVIFGRYFNGLNGGQIAVGDTIEILTAPW